MIFTLHPIEELECAFPVITEGQKSFANRCGININGIRSRGQSFSGKLRIEITVFGGKILFGGIEKGLDEAERMREESNATRGERTHSVRS